jgi:hypothetical protein
VGAGVGLELRSGSLANEADQICPGTQCASQHGVNVNETARHDAQLAIVGFAAGGAALVAASVLWLFVPGPRETTALLPVLGADRVGVSFAKSF